VVVRVMCYNTPCGCFHSNCVFSPTTKSSHSSHNLIKRRQKSQATTYKSSKRYV